MLEFQEKKKIRKFLYSRYTLAILAVVLLVSVNATYNMYRKAGDTSQNRDIALREKDVLREKQAELESHLEQLKTERGIEEEIRKKYRVVKEGEAVIIVVDAKEDAASTTAGRSGFEPLFDRIKNWFK